MVAQARTDPVQVRIDTPSHNSVSAGGIPGRHHRVQLRPPQSDHCSACRQVLLALINSTESVWIESNECIIQISVASLFPTRMLYPYLQAPDGSK